MCFYGNTSPHLRAPSRRGEPRSGLREHGGGNAGGEDRTGASSRLRGPAVLGAPRRASLGRGRRAATTEGSGETCGGRRCLSPRPPVPMASVQGLSGGSRRGGPANRGSRGAAPVRV